MSAHTPGPWTATRPRAASNYGAMRVYVEGGGRTIATVAFMRDKTFDQSTDDARLIAAAPELLKALATLLSIASDSVEYGDWPELQDACAEASAAIAKSEGE